MEINMVKKLTLTLDSKVIEAAKVYAKKNNMSLSGIVGLYFKTLSSGINNNKIPPITKELSGIARFATAKSDKELLEEALSKRFI
jgi:predicted nucleic acid-binding protein